MGASNYICSPCGSKPPSNRKTHHENTTHRPHPPHPFARSLAHDERGHERGLPRTHNERHEALAGQGGKLGKGSWQKGGRLNLP
ncbi:hypothetical protein BOTBODRAFT_32176 [Botryobasidium botryosum FD-172 SS1]|uniref:Uncharacterized protein n=1 Tax=Botryobasidium botryosum (strain FD-172 SS1) TaxID=930990 RepID=A0A067MH41_BOTB1|nr:hypothetical protein BOTBODRAFT_32176 [Botryobasidium botryosum FD-172 SS1]